MAHLMFRIWLEFMFVPQPDFTGGLAFLLATKVTLLGEDGAELGRMAQAHGPSMCRAMGSIPSTTVLHMANVEAGGSGAQGSPQPHR